MLTEVGKVKHFNKTVFNKLYLASGLLGSLIFIGEINSNKLISEYGMSELASAAYTLPRPERPLRFQENVVPFVVDGLKHAQNGDAQARGVAPLAMTASRSGTGLLGVFDFNRIDIPAPIITEDVVRLAADGTFELLGRAHTAPLKGCSLLADGGGHGGAKTTHRHARKHAIARKHRQPRGGDLGLRHHRALWHLLQM